jgi:hypothetical protein
MVPPRGYIWDEEAYRGARGQGGRTPRARPHAPIYIENQLKTRKELGPIRADKSIRQRGFGRGAVESSSTHTYYPEA